MGTTTDSFGSLGCKHGVTDQYAGPATIPGVCLCKSVIQGPMAALNSLCNPAVNGISLRAPVEPLVGIRCVTGSCVSTFASPWRIRVIQGVSDSYSANGTRRTNSS